MIKSRRILIAVICAAFLFGLGAAGLHFIWTNDHEEVAVEDAPADPLPQAEYAGVRERDELNAVFAAVPEGGWVSAERAESESRAHWYPAVSSVLSLHCLLLEDEDVSPPTARIFARGDDLSVHLRGEEAPEHWDYMMKSVERTLQGIREDAAGARAKNFLLPTHMLPADDGDETPFREVTWNELQATYAPEDTDHIYVARLLPRGSEQVVLEQVPVQRSGDDSVRPERLLEALLATRFDAAEGRGFPVSDDVSLREVSFSPGDRKAVIEFDSPWWERDDTWADIALDCLRSTMGSISDLKELEISAGDGSALKLTPLSSPVNDLRDHWPERGDDGSLRLHAVGDVMLDRGVRTVIDEEGRDYPYEYASEVFHSGDLTFANLESPLADSGEPLPGKGIWFRGDPENVAALHRAGIDVVSLANNHALDYGRPAFLETFEHLREWGILAFGGGRDVEEAHEPLFWEGRGVRMAFLGYTEFADIFWSWEHQETFAAGEDLAGVAPLDRDRMLDDVRQYRDEVDALIVSVHWGEEYVPHPPEEHSALGIELVQTGADAILGHHPHVLQCVNVEDNRPIIHSLGNFVFDQTALRRTESVIARLDWAPHDDEGFHIRPSGVKFLPYRIRDGQPAPAGGDDADSIIDYLTEISAVWGTELWREGDALHLDLPE